MAHAAGEVTALLLAIPFLGQWFASCGGGGTLEDLGGDLANTPSIILECQRQFGASEGERGVAHRGGVMRGD